MSKCSSTFTERELSAYAEIKQRCHGKDIYFLNPRDGRSWFISKLSDNSYAYIYLPNKRSPLRVVPTSDISWDRMMKDSQLVTNSNGLPYEHRE